MNSTINRFLSRREKDGSHKRDKSQDKSKVRRPLCFLFPSLVTHVQRRSFFASH